jgi:DNA uptake protein ComE-like DNA-binding protein
MFHKKLIRQRSIDDPYYRLRSLAEIATAAELGIKIDVNRAGVDDWLRLPGISIHQARSLVQLSQSGVQFYSIEDIAAALNLSVQYLRPLAPVLSFCYYEESDAIGRVNPNTASVDRLRQIPIVDASLASTIVENRMAIGPYRNLVDFQQRLSLSGQLTGQLMHYLQF